MTNTPPSLGTSVQQIVAAWQQVRAYGPSGHETAIANVPFLGTFQWGMGPDGKPELQRVDRGLGRIPTFVPATATERDEVLEAIANGQAQIRTSGTCGPYADRSGVGRTLHQATGRPLPSEEPIEEKGRA